MCSPKMNTSHHKAIATESLICFSKADLKEIRVAKKKKIPGDCWIFFISVKHNIKNIYVLWLMIAKSNL